MHVGNDAKEREREHSSVNIGILWECLPFNEHPFLGLWEGWAEGTRETRRMRPQRGITEDLSAIEVIFGVIPDPEVTLGMTTPFDIIQK